MDIPWQGAPHILQVYHQIATSLIWKSLAAPDLLFPLPSSHFQLPEVAYTYPFDPAFSLLFWEPWNGARQIPEQALLDTGRSKSAFCLHQASNNISNPTRAFHHNTGNLTLDGYVDRLGSQRGRGDHLKHDCVRSLLFSRKTGNCRVRWEKQESMVQSRAYLTSHFQVWSWMDTSFHLRTSD